MARSLRNLIRLHRWQVDERRRELGELIAREQSLRERLVELETELAAEQKVAGDSPTARLTLGAYFLRYRERREELFRAIAAAAKEVAAARDRLADAYRQLKTFEVTQTNRDRLKLAEINRKEQIGLDEMGLEIFSRRSGAKRVDS